MTAAPPIPHPLPEPLVELIAARFRVLGEPMRIKLLDRLRDGDATVRAPEPLGASQQNVSKHLGVLLSAGIVGRSQARHLVRYSIADPGVFELCEQVCGGLRGRSHELDQILHADGRTMSPPDPACAVAGWPLERVLFAMAGTMTLLSALLAAVASPWFLLLTAFVGVNQWLYVLSARARRRCSSAALFGLRSTLYTPRRSAVDDRSTDRSAASAATPQRTSAPSRSAGLSSRWCSASSRRRWRRRSPAPAGRPPARSRSPRARASTRTSRGSRPAP